MEISSIYGERQFFGLADVQDGRTITATIESVALERRDDPHDFRPGHLRLVLTLSGQTRKLALNRRNAETLTFHFGDDPDKNWPGKSIVLYGVTEPHRGAMRPALRVRTADPDPEQKPGFACAARAALSGLFDGSKK